MSRESHCDVQGGSTTLGVISLRVGHSVELSFLRTRTKTTRLLGVLSHRAFVLQGLFERSQLKLFSESQCTMCKHGPKRAMSRW